MKPQRTDFLRSLLVANAAFCGIGGLACAAAPAALSTLLGLEAAPLLRGLGIFLASYAGLVFFMAGRPVIARPFVLFVALADAAWVLASTLLLLIRWPPFSPSGQWAIGILAVIADVFATLQWMEWRKM